MVCPFNSSHIFLLIYRVHIYLLVLKNVHIARISIFFFIFEENELLNLVSFEEKLHYGYMVCPSNSFHSFQIYVFCKTKRCAYCKDFDTQQIHNFL